MYAKGIDTSELTLFPLMFQTYLNVFYWRVDFIANNPMSPGMASLVLKKNQLPSYGVCTIDKFSGTSLNTWFTITCTGWEDSDGYISTYEYLSKNNNSYN